MDIELPFDKKLIITVPKSLLKNASSIKAINDETDLPSVSSRSHNNNST